MTDGFATPIPATALVTDTAGVKIPSAMVKLGNILGSANFHINIADWAYAVPNRHYEDMKLGSNWREAIHNSLPISKEANGPVPLKCSCWVHR
jgi:hypothetical protein